MKEVYKLVLIIGFIISLNPMYSQGISRDSLFTPTYLSLKLPQYQAESTSSILYNTGFKANELPFFCKMEHQLQLKSRIPVRIRLGCVRYVDGLESKN